MCFRVRVVRLCAPTRQPASTMDVMTVVPTPDDGFHPGSENWHSDTSSASRAWSSSISPHVAAKVWYAFSTYCTTASCSHAPSMADRPPRMSRHDADAMSDSTFSVTTPPPPPALPSSTEARRGVVVPVGAPSAGNTIADGPVATVGDAGADVDSRCEAEGAISGVPGLELLCARADFAAKCECSDSGVDDAESDSDTFTRHCTAQQG